MAKKQYPAFKYNARVRRVIDGDTIEIMLDLGFGIYHSQTIRLFGINAPELKGKTKAEGLKSKEYLSKLVNELIVVETFQGKKEKYGRYLGVIYHNNIEINKEMLKLGLATEYII